MDIAVIGGCIINRIAAWVLLKQLFFVYLLEKPEVIRKEITAPSKLQRFSSSCLQEFVIPLIKDSMACALLKKTISPSYAINKYCICSARNLSSFFSNKVTLMPLVSSKTAGLAG